MALRLQQNQNWIQKNDSDKTGVLYYTKNINFDKTGYLKLSPRTINVFDDSGNVSDTSNTSFGIAAAFGRTSYGEFKNVTTSAMFNITLSPNFKTIRLDAEDDSPNTTADSHGRWWQKRYHVSSSSSVSYLTGSTWTAGAITGLTSGVRHYMEVFKNRNEFCVSNGNVVKQYSTSYVNTTNLTLPSDFEVTGMVYNNYQMGIITRLGDDSTGQNNDSYFFTWNGSQSTAQVGVSLGSYSGVCLVAYKSSFVVLTSDGQILYWNGGGFDEIARFPFYLTEKRWGDLTNHLSFGDNLVVEGDIIYINIGFDFDATGKKGEEIMQSCPSGVWCYDPPVGLYHRYSPSNSKVYVHAIESSNINIATDTFTTMPFTTGIVPATGNPVITTDGTSGGLNVGYKYFIIKLSSTTFKIALTKEDAEAGVAIDITSASGTQTFWMYDIIDYGITKQDRAGAVALFGTSTSIYQDIIFGSRIRDTALTSQDTMCMAVPLLESRGYFVSQKIYLDSVEDITQKLFIKHAVLDTDDQIILKVKTRDYVGIPVSSGTIIWTDEVTASISSDLSEAFSAFGNGEELELELVAGVGSGQLVKILDMRYSNGTYVITTEDNVIGATVLTKSSFIIDNWKVAGAVTSSSQSRGIFEVPIGTSSRWIQFKVELRGFNTTIEDFLIVSSPHKPLT